MHLRQPATLEKSGFTYSVCGPFTESKERMQKFKETGDSRYFYQNELERACFQHGTACGDFKDLLEEQFLIKYCVIKHLILLKIQNMMDINVDLLQWFTNFLIKKLLLVVSKMRIFQTRVLWT